MGRGEEESRFIGCERGNQRKKKRNTGMTRNKNERYVVKEKKTEMEDQTCSSRRGRKRKEGRVREGDHKKTKEPTNLRQRSPVYPTAEAQRSNGVTSLNFTPFEVGQRE